MLGGDLVERPSLTSERHDALIELTYPKGRDARLIAIVAPQLRSPAAGLPPQFSAELEGGGPDVLRAAREHGLEGIVSKRRGSTYRSDRMKSWVKAVCTVRDSFAVIGAAGSPVERCLVRLVEGKLIRCGWAGYGLTVAAERDVRAARDAKRPIIVDIDHRGLTPVGELRHPVVRAWRAV
jgi:bifunctional non-homologous end joining protein LigD